MAGRQDILRLYRCTLKAAQKFPSIKREAIIRDIKEEFRKNMLLKDPNRIKEEIAVGVRSLEQLLEFAGLDQKNVEWAIQLKGACE